MTEREKTIEINIDSNTTTGSSGPSPSSQVDQGKDETLSERLYKKKEYSVNGKEVKGRVVDIDSGNNWVRFYIERLTDEKVVTDTFRIPEPWDDNSRLARILEAYDYSPATVDAMEGETVHLRPFFTGWKIVDPKARSRQKRRMLFYLGLFAFIYAGGLTYAILTGNLLFFMLLSFPFFLPFILALIFLVTFIVGTRRLFR